MNQDFDIDLDFGNDDFDEGRKVRNQTIDKVKEWFKQSNDIQNLNL